MTDPVIHQYAVDVTSGFGTMQKQYCDFCREAFGRKRSIWDISSYGWSYTLTFKYESHATLFVLKFK